MSDLITIARPYAEAAFDFAVENNVTDLWVQMLSFAAEVTRNKQIHELLTGSMSADKLVEIFVAVCGDQVDVHGQNLLKVMAESGRLAILPDVYEQFLAIKKERDKEIDVEVISASELSEEQCASISSKLEQRLELKVKLNCSIDKALLGGVIIRAVDLVIDDSVRGRLNRLSDVLQS